jgi:hypothetical protein
MLQCEKGYGVVGERRIPALDSTAVLGYGVIG